MLVGYSRPARSGEVKKLTVTSVPIEESSLPEFLRGVPGIDLRIHMTVGDDQVFPSVVVDIQKCGAPSKILGVHRQSGRNGGVVEVISTQISVQSVRVVCKVSLENIQKAVAIEVACRHTHSCLLAAVFVVRYASLPGDLLNALACQVVVVQVWRGIAGHVDIGPPVIVKIRDQCGETVAALRPGNMHLVGDVGEISVAVVLIQRYRFRRQSAGPT